MSRTLPLSVIVSTCESGATLEEALAAIRASDLPRDSYELIVVDDASRDRSVAIAARYADTVVKLPLRRCGPAYARNRGVELSRGEVVAFVDGDVVIPADTLTGMLAILEARPEVDAVAASRHERPAARNFVSQYWNLLLRFGEERYSSKSAQFPTGCGAVRREVFIAAGMYDEWRFASASLECLELGERLLARGHRVVLSASLQAAQLRRWSALGICSEIWTRSTLIARSLGYSRMNAVAPSDVVFTLSRTLVPGVALLGAMFLAAAFVPSSAPATRALMALACLVFANFPLFRFYARARGVGFAMLSAPVHVLIQIVAATALVKGWILRDVLGDVAPDATTQAYAEVGLEVWPPIPRRR